MHLQQRLLKKILEENYKTDDLLESVSSFNVLGTEYHLTRNYLKTVKTLLKGLIEKAFTIEDEKFYIAGGSVLTLLMYGSPFLIRDIDIYPQTQEDFDKLKVKLDSKCQSWDITENVNSRVYKFGSNLEIDLIKKFYPTIDDCLNSFDFNVVKLGFTEKFEFKIGCYLEDVFNFKLKILQPTTPDIAFTRLRRILKYTNKGFNLQPSHFMEVLATFKTNENKFEGKDAMGFKELNKNWSKVFNEIVEESSKNYHEKINKDIETKDIKFF